MIVGVPKEIKNHEYRVGLTPASVRELVTHGHTVIVEANAGQGIGMDDAAYIGAGARIVGTAEQVFAGSEMIVKVKEPQAIERQRLTPNHVLFTYLHLAPDPEQTQDLLASGALCIAYETVTSATGGLPLLAPMSEVAGRMAVQAGAWALEKSKGGRGVLLGGVPGVEPAKIVILGGGVVGANAALTAVGSGADVVVIDRSLDVLRRLVAQFGTRIKTVFATTEAIEENVIHADLVIGGVLIPGASAPKLVSRALLKKMRPGAVVVDVAIDQGGCFETSRPTTHADPIYEVDGIIHYCVANMPGGVPRTSTFALNNATLPYSLALADKGARRALNEDPHLLNGLNVCAGKVTNKAVAAAMQMPFTNPHNLI
jgi:alanine dehydrogenase